MPTLWVQILSLSLLSLLSGAASAVIVTGPQGRNTIPPLTKALQNSGWQYEGSWLTFTGTPIAPNYFITAAHIGGNVGQPINFNGVDYTTTAMFDDPSSDLRIWQIDGTFPVFAPLFTKSGERGKQAVLHGRGTARGDQVRLGKAFKGWLWGADDHVLSWGTNGVQGISDGGAGIGSTLRFAFNKAASKNEGAISGGDSGGGVFIRDNRQWKLAGINYAAEGPFSFIGASDDHGFSAALTDEGGLYLKSPAGIWNKIPDRAANVPEFGYATRISTNLLWINSVLAGTASPSSSSSLAVTDIAQTVPEPSIIALLPMLLVARRPRRRRR